MSAYLQVLQSWLPEPFFQTQGFLRFAAIVFTLYWLIPRRFNQARVLLLVVASLHFYAAWNAVLALLVLGTSLLDYLFAHGMIRCSSLHARRVVLVFSIAMNLGVLAYFKYRSFFLNELHDLLLQIGMPPGYDKLDLARLLIPFGISFYTFEAISYAVDVYQRRIEPERNPIRFLLFILFFPHLVAGPIVRAGDFLRQTRRLKRWNWPRMLAGLQYFALGVFKKFAIADRMAVFADPVFADPDCFSSAANWLAVLAYSLRIYCDFSGYSDMAIGLAHLFGFQLSRNFDAPYLAANVSEFWRRWHISLSSWLRDYVFIPLGGSRCGEPRIAINLLIVMLLGGLWHGANWTYLAWGLYHGVLLALHRFTSRYFSLPRVAAIPLTFTAVSLGWVLFRPEWAPAISMLEKLFCLSGGLPLPLHHRSLWWTAAAFFLLTMLVRTKLRDCKPPAPLVGSAMALGVCLAMMLAPATEKTFIYFIF